MKSKQVFILYYQLVKADRVNLHNRLLHNIPAKVQEQICIYNEETDRLLRTAGFLLLRKGLLHLYPEADTLLELSYTRPTGKKSALVGVPVSFSLSYSHEVAICILAENFETGIDIEYCKQQRIDLMQDYFDPESWKTIEQAANPLHEFYKYWTQKEAVLKAAGQAISEDSLKEIVLEQSKSYFGSKHYMTQNLHLITDYVISWAYQVQKDYSEVEPSIVKVRYQDFYNQ